MCISRLQKHFEFDGLVYPTNLAGARHVAVVEFSTPALANKAVKKFGTRVIKVQPSRTSVYYPRVYLFN